MGAFGAHIPGEGLRIHMLRGRSPSPGSRKRDPTSPLRGEVTTESRCFAAPISSNRTSHQSQCGASTVEAVLAIKGSDYEISANGENGRAQARELTEIAGIDQRGTTARREIADQRMDLRLRGNIDALRRVLEQQHGGVAREPFGQDDLLLIAARKSA